MAKAKYITKDVITAVARLHRSHPSYTAGKIRDEVNKQLRASDKAISKKWPGLSAVQKIIQSLKKETFWENEWTVQSLTMSEIPADALPLVLDSYGLTVAWGFEKRLSVREAKWVARLYHVLKDIEELTIAAIECANEERINQPINDRTTGIVDVDFISRAITGKPGVSYKYIGDGNIQISLRGSELWEIDIVDS